MSPHNGVIVGVDQGKSGTRARAHDPSGRVLRAEAVTAGFDYGSSAEPDEALVSSVVCAVAALGLRDRPTVMVVVSTAAPESPESARTCAHAIALHTGARRVLLAEDAVGAHLGALAGRPGVVVSAGTGSVALWTDGVSSRRVDGWGPLLGDDGSGYDIGARGLHAAFAAFDGRGPTTRLASLARDHLDGLGLDAARRVHSRTDTIALLSNFAPVVSDAAAKGDDIALRILEDAGGRLAATACVAVGSSVRERVGIHASYTGRVFQSQPVLDSFQRHAEKSRLRLQSPKGDSLSGALRLAHDPDSHLFDDLMIDTDNL